MASGKPIGSFYVQLGLNTKEFQKNLKGAERDLKTAFGSAAIRTSEVLAASMAALSGAIIAVGAASVKMAADLERQQVAFTRLMGSAGAAKERLRDLQEFASKTPYTFTELVEYEKRLLALGFQAGETRKMLTTIGDAASGLGMGAEGVGRIIKAFGDIRAKGYAQTQEIRQLAEAGIPAFEILAQKIGVTIPKAMDLVEARAISAETALSAFTEGINQRFGGMMALQAETMLGMWSTVIDEGENVMRVIGAQITESTELKAVMMGVRDAAQEFRKTLEDKGFSDAFSGLLGSNAVIAIKLTAGAITGALIPAIISMGIAIKAAILPLLPLIGAGAGATALVLGITSLIDKATATKDPFDGKNLQDLEKMLADQRAKYSAASAKLNQLTDPSQSYRRAAESDITTQISAAEVQYQGELDMMNRITAAIATHKERQTATMSAVEQTLKNAAAAAASSDNPLLSLYKNITGKGENATAKPFVMPAGTTQKTSTGPSEAEKMAEEARRASETIEQLWINQTQTKSAQLDYQRNKELETLNKSKEYNKNYARDMQMLDEVYYQKKIELMQSTNEEEIKKKVELAESSAKMTQEAIEHEQQLAETKYEAMRAELDGSALEAQLTADMQAADLEAYIAHLDAKSAAHRAHLEGQRQMIDVYNQMQSDATRSQASYMAEAYRTVYSGLTETLTGIVTGAKNAGEAFKALGMELIQMVVRWQIQRKLAAVFSKSIQATELASSTAMAAATAAAWAPAAAMVAAATFGASTASAAAGLTSLNVLSRGLAIPGLATGGIVTKPTLAMIGEGNESEAVIPLSRLNDFGGGANVQLNVINQSGTPVSARSTQRMDGSKMVIDLFLEGYSRNVSGIQDVVGRR